MSRSRYSSVPDDIQKKRTEALVIDPRLSPSGRQRSASGAGKIVWRESNYPSVSVNVRAQPYHDISSSIVWPQSFGPDLNQSSTLGTGGPIRRRHSRLRGDNVRRELVHDFSLVAQEVVPGTEAHDQSSIGPIHLRQILRPKRRVMGGLDVAIHTDPIVAPEYRDYLQRRDTQSLQPMYAFDAYDPLGRSPGEHQSFGSSVSGQSTKHYPSPELSQLGQSDPRYKHPSESKLPRVAKTGRTAVYGTHQNMPVHGPADYHEFYTDWTLIGDQHMVPIPPKKPLPPDELNFVNKYGITFTRSLGQGGFGSVWRVRTTRLYTDANGKFIAKDAACKVISLTTFIDPSDTVRDAVDKLLEESANHSELNHENVVKFGHLFNIHDQVSGFPFCRCLMFMELCTGDLKSLIQKHPNQHFDESEAFLMFNHVTLGLQYLHDHNIVHLDLKVHNVMYVRQGRSGPVTYKLGDFGLSKKFPGGQVPRLTGDTGTPLYWPPEMEDTPQNLNEIKPMDVYCCGLILAESLAGIREFYRMLREMQNFTQQVANDWSVGQHCRDLLVSMTNKDSVGRPTIAQVRQSQWFVNYLSQH